jgi:hypothetical protein
MTTESMERGMRTRVAPGVTLVAAALAAVGCGAEKNYANNPRPPVPITVTANISANRVSVSPSSFGAGPIELLVANLTSSSQQLTLETDQIGCQHPIKQQTAPINPQDTAALKVDVGSCTYSVRVESRSIKPAKLQVGASRPSGQNQLLQP